MSVTKPQSKIEQFLAEDEARHELMMASARKALRTKSLYEPNLGRCFNCGRETSLKQQIQCWHCPESRTPSPTPSLLRPVH